MRILFLLTQDLESPSGLGRYRPLSEALVRLGHEVTVVALHPDFQKLTSRRIIQNGVNVDYVAPMHVKKSGNLKTYYPAWKLMLVTATATLRMARAALKEPADIVHIGKPHPMNSIAGLAAKYIKGRTLYLDCDDLEAEGGHFSSLWQKRLVSMFERNIPFFAEKVTTNTSTNRLRLLLSGINPERVIDLPNGVDRARFAEPDPAAVTALRKRLELEDKKVVIFAGSLSKPSHPVALLLDAFARVSRERPEACLLLVGGGDEYATLQDKAKRLGISQKVIFQGRVSPQEVPLYYHLADVSVDPVYDDGAARGRSPLKLFESWACGVPFVSGDAGDRRKLLGEPPAGLLVRPGDPVSLGEAILRVLGDPDLGAALCQLGKERVQSYYWDKLARILESEYHASPD